MVKPFGKTTVVTSVRPFSNFLVWSGMLVVLTCAAGAVGAQTVRFGLRAGVSAASEPDDIKRFNYQARNYELSVEDVRLGFHFGIVLQARLGKIALQPELLFHSTRTDYRLGELLGSGLVETIRTEKFSHVEVPVLLGYRWGPLRLQAGPVGRAYVASSSEFEGVAGFVSDPTDFAVGYQAGIGFDIRRVLVDLKYDGSFEDVGRGINIGGELLEFSKTSGRTFLTIGLLFN